MTLLNSAKLVCLCRLFLWTMAVSSISAEDQLTGYNGDYSYNNGSYGGVVDDVVNRSVAAVDYVGDAAQGASNFLNRTMNFGAWRSSNNAYGNLTGGLRSQFSRPGSTNGSTVSLLQAGGIAPDPWLNFKLGPFYLDNIYGGAGMIYSDYSGSPLDGRSGDVRAASDDSWASVIWAQTRLTAYLTNRFAMSLNPSIYYLPFKGQVGWGLGNLFSNVTANTAPASILQMGWRFPLANSYDVSFYDQFNAIHSQVSLFRNSPYYWSNVADQTPVDFAGRYQFGGFGGFDRPRSSGSSRLAIKDKLFDANSMFFMNQASVNMRGFHSGNIVSNIFYNRLDYWDHNMDNAQNWHTLGAILMQQGPVLSPYFRTEVTSSDYSGRQNHYEYALVGANMRLNPNLLIYAESGWMTTTIENQGSSDSWIGRLGFRHRLGPYTSHGIDVSRNPVENFANRYLVDSAQYYITQQIGPKSSIRLYVQQADLKSLGGVGAVDRSVTTAGALAEARLSAKSTLSLAASYENVDVPRMNRNFELWTYRLMYNRTLGQSISGNVYYQYQEAGSGVNALDTFSENFLFVGLIKRF